MELVCCFILFVAACRCLTFTFGSIGIEPVVEPVRLFDADPDLDDRRKPDILIRNPRGFDRQVILDVAVTGVDMFGRVTYDDPYKPLEDRFKQKINKYMRVANQNGLQFIPAVFSHTGQMHGEVKRFIKDQIRLVVVVLILIAVFVVLVIY